MSRFTFGLALTLGLLVPLSLLAAEPAQPAPRCALLDPEMLDRVAILEAKLAADPATIWVERNAIEQVLKEQQVQALFSANGVGQRAKLGRLLKADVLVLVRRVKDVKEPTFEVVVCESVGGMRLLVRGVAESKNAGDDVEALRSVVMDGLKKYGETVREVVAVPPFISNNLTYENDYLKSAFAKLAEQTALGRPGVVAVELAEAEALAKELALAAPADKINRPLPLYLVGEFRHDGRGADQMVTVKVRVERGGKLIGKPVELKVKPETAGATIRTWMADTLDAVLADKVARPPADPIVEAKRLGELAANHRRLGNWEETLILLEAGLLLDPEQDKFRGYAIDVIHQLIYRTNAGAARKELETVSMYRRLHRRGLEHLQPVIDRNDDLKSFYENGVRDALNSFFNSATNIVVRQEPGPLAEVEKWRADRREFLFQLIPRIAKRGFVADENSFVYDLFTRVSPNHRYALLEKLLHEVRLLPDPKGRALRYIREARLHEPDNGTAKRQDRLALDAFLDRLKASENVEWQNVATEMKKQLANEDKVPAKVDVPLPSLEGIALRPVEFILEEGGQRVEKVHSILALYPGVDLVWADGVLHLMKEKGKLRPLPAVQKLQAAFTSARYDGRYVWAVGQRPKAAPVLVILDPRTERTWEVTKADGFPQPSEEQIRGVRIESMALAAIEPGRAAIVGIYGERTWVAIATFDPQAGKAEVKVVHEAREVYDPKNLPQRKSAAVNFCPSYIAALTSPAGLDGKVERRLMVGRGQRNYPISELPLLFDLDRQTVVITKDEFPSLRISSAVSHLLGITDNPVYFLESGHWLPPNTAQIFRFGFPDLVKKPVGKVLPVGGTFVVIVHDGRFYYVRMAPTNHELWAMDLDGKESRRLATNLPKVLALASSSHYGLVGFVPGRFAHPHLREFRAIEFTEPPKK